MQTALKVISTAFSLIKVKTAGVDLDDNEIETGIETLNDMMTEQAADGLMLGYSVIEDKNDIVTVPDWSLRAVKTNLAILLAAEFEGQVTPELVSSATQSFTAIKNRSVEIGNVAFPDTLPVGAGNRVGADQNQFNFFPDEDFNDLIFENRESATTERSQQIDIEVEE